MTARTSVWRPMSESKAATIARLNYEKKNLTISLAIIQKDIAYLLYEIEGFKDASKSLLELPASAHEKQKRQYSHQIAVKYCEIEVLRCKERKAQEDLLEKQEEYEASFTLCD